MSLKKVVIRDGQNRKIGSVTTDSSDEFAVVRDAHERLLGRSSERLHTTRDEHSRLISTNSADPGLLLGRKK